MTDITTHKSYTDEYKKLAFVKDKLNMLSAFNYKSYFYKVKDVYFDLGQNWMWTTICCDCIKYSDHGNTARESSYQILSPRDYDRILEAESTRELDDIANELWDRRIK